MNLNGAGNEQHAPFGGMKQSGNGREWGRFGIDEFAEVKAISGWAFEDSLPVFAVLRIRALCYSEGIASRAQ